MSLKVAKPRTKTTVKLSDDINTVSKQTLADFPVQSPLPMQYLGSKTRISRWIMANISEHLPQVETFIDLFSGTGVVSLEAASQGLNVILNDIQPYSYAVLNALFGKSHSRLESVIEGLHYLNKKSALLSGARNVLRDSLTEEDTYFRHLTTGDVNWKLYKKFCNDTPRISGNESREKLVYKNPCLFSTYYPNTYFGIRQCLEIDTIREYAESLDERKKSIVLAATISAMSFAVSSTTHLAQFIKPNNLKQAQFLLKKRNKSIIELVISRLEALQKSEISKALEIYNSDYLVALKKIKNVKNAVVYADPPYFKEHYSRYYHVLDTFYLYDYPEISINAQTKKITEGKYRANRIISDFGLRSKVAQAFKALLDACGDRKLPVVISYADTSLIDKTKMKAIILESGYKIVSLKQQGLMHSAQGQPSNKIAQEYLYTLMPQDA